MSWDLEALYDAAQLVAPYRTPDGLRLYLTTSEATIAALTREQDEAVYRANKLDSCLGKATEMARAHRLRAEQAEAERDLLITAICGEVCGPGCQGSPTKNAIACLKSMREEEQGVYEALEAERDRLAAEVGEAKALLEEAYPFIGWATKPEGLLPRIDAFLGRRAGENQS